MLLLFRSFVLVLALIKIYGKKMEEGIAERLSKADFKDLRQALRKQILFILLSCLSVLMTELITDLVKSLVTDNWEKDRIDY